jgi:hypothetical protein
MLAVQVAAEMYYYSIITALIQQNKPDMMCGTIQRCGVESVRILLLLHV